jgi:hypothetical protein
MTGNEEREMKLRSAIVLNLIFLAASLPVAARKSPPRPINLHAPITLNGAKVPAGIYDLSWDSRSSAVRISLWKDGQFIATAPGVWMKSGIKFTEDAVLLRVNRDGTRSLVEIRLAGIAKTIVLDVPESVVQLNAK